MRAEGAPNSVAGRCGAASSDAECFGSLPRLSQAVSDFLFRSARCAGPQALRALVRPVEPENGRHRLSVEAYERNETDMATENCSLGERRNDACGTIFGFVLYRSKIL